MDFGRVGADLSTIPVSVRFEIQIPCKFNPAQKWLKDRKGRILDFEDIMHYQRIIKALVETDKVMREIDGVG